MGQFERCAWLPLVLLISPSHAGAAEKHPTGREIFRQECAKCHGRKGEGVKGKYDGPLQGERSLEKLARYIERNMPDDNPGKIVGQDAAAVARYIYDTFYSPEVRLRSNKPPRVELVRLTNLQYLNSVADLIKDFTGKDAALNEERGLQASYYNSRNNDEGKVFDRVDRQVDFDFGEGSPDPKLNGTNGFSMQWRGSLIADETGDYEFILKTQNGGRLWVNDDEEPLIDAWVSSGQLTEHRSSIRLLGGRVYPLKLNYFKFKDKIASISLQWKPPHGTQQPVPARNLAPGHTTPTFVIATPFPPDDSSVGYERGVAISKAWDEAATQAAIEAANYVVRKLDTLSGSKRGDTNRAAKAQSFCGELMAKAFRRPLTEEQKRVFISSQFKKKANVEDAVKLVVLLTLKSPRFLYLGLDDARPDDFETAARLSYGLWDSLPDQDLRKLAAQGALHTREQIAPQAQRMLGDARARAKMQYFFHHWLQMDRVEILSKDDKLFPGFSPAIIADLRTSLNLFLEDTTWRTASDYRTLLLADYLFLNNRLAEFYGVSTNLDKSLIKLNELHEGEADAEKSGRPAQIVRDNVKDDFVKVRFDAEKRCGILTHPYLLSAFAYQKLTSPIHRGVFLTRNIVGRSLKPPPMAMTFKDADFAPNLTMRQKVAQLTGPQACQSCHSVINPLGFSLEQFDAVGRFRTSDNDRPIDAVSDYVTDDGQTVRLGGARDVAEFAIGSEQALNGFIEQLFHQAVKQPLLAYGADTMTRLRQSFVASGFNMQKLLVEIVAISALHGVEKAPKTDPTTSVRAAASQP